MSKHIIAGHIYWQHNKYMSKPQIIFNEYDMRTWDEASRDGRVHITEHSFEVDVPDDFDPRPQMISALKAEQRAVRAAMSKRIMELDEQINRLLAIEMTVEAA